jgi:DNA-binding FrmR family transcriptional regulator
MAHIRRHQNKLLPRVRRIGGQVAAIEAALQGEADCADVLVQIAAVRGAVHGLMMEVLGAHLAEHVGAERDARKRARELAAVAALMRTYLR